MNSPNLAASPNQLPPDTAKIVTDRESKVTNEIGGVTTPHARVPSSVSVACAIPDGNRSGGIGRNPLPSGLLSIAMRNRRAGL
jgi:hypothetical protein